MEIVVKYKGGGQEVFDATIVHYQIHYQVPYPPYDKIALIPMPKVESITLYTKDIVEPTHVKSHD